MAAVEVQNGNGASQHVADSKAAAVTFSVMKAQLYVEAQKAGDALQFYKAAFGAEEVSRSVHPKRKAEQELPLILSAELKIGSTVFVVSDADESSPVKGGSAGAGCCAFCLETEDVDAAVAKAVAAGAVKEAETAEGGEDGACCGGRVGRVTDPYGFIWLICCPAKKAADVAA